MSETPFLDITLYQQIIGVILDYAPFVADADQIIKPEYFREKNYQQLYLNCLNSFKVNASIDPYDENLRKGTTFELQDLLNFRDEGEEFSFKKNINLLKDKTQRLRLFQASQKMVNFCAEGKTNQELLEKFNQLYSWAIISANEEDTGILKILDKTVEHIAYRAELDGKISGITTGYYHLDKLTDGWRSGIYGIVAAYASVGKTSFALNSVIPALNMGKSIAYFSLEMSDIRLAERLITILGDIDSYHIRRGEMNPDEYENYVKAVEHIKKWENRLHLYTKGGMKLENIVMDARRQRMTTGLDILIVDYIQQVCFEGSHRMNQEGRISEVSRQLQAIAREENIAVIALSQFSREGIKDQYGKRRKNPPLWALRGSGMLENDADLVVFLDRDKKENNHELRWQIEKNRDGGLGIGKLNFHTYSQRISEWQGGKEDETL